MNLDADYLAQAAQRARQFSGCLDAGTSGALAADVLRLLSHSRMLRERVESLEMRVKQMRCDAERGPAVAEAACDESGIPHDWILRGEAELKSGRSVPPLTGDGVLNDGGQPATTPAQRLLEHAIAATIDRRANYSPPQEHFARTVGAINAVFAHVLRRPLTPTDWACFMALDKLARFNGDRATYDQLVDVAGYMGCAAETSGLQP